MTTITYTAPSGRTGTYTVIGCATKDDARAQMDRISELTNLLCSSVTTDGDPATHADNLYQAAACLRAEMDTISNEHPFGIWALSAALSNGLSGVDYA